MPFRPGQSGNPLGRPRGARDKLGTAFVQALAQDFHVHGAKVIAKVRRDRPHDYLKIVASTIPKDTPEEPLLSRSPDLFSDEELTAIMVNGLTDEQLRTVIDMSPDGPEEPDEREAVDGKFNGQ